MTKTQVMILGTIHGMHKDNQHYSFEDVFQLIQDFNPHILGVEIRPEDMGQPREYLNKYYPYEMIEARFRFQNKFQVVGFDWLGSTIAGQLIPEGYFETLELKALEREFAATQDQAQTKELLQIIDNTRFDLLVGRSAREINDGRYDVAVEILHGQLAVLLKGTKYEAMAQFYRERDENIDQNIISIIQQNPGNRIMFIAGVDHKVFALKAIGERLGNQVTICPVE